jgi:subtilase family serine protease
MVRTIRRNDRRLAVAACRSVVEAIESRIFLSAAATPDFYPVLPVRPVGSGGSSPDTGSTYAQTGGLTVAQVRGAYGLGSVTSSNILFPTSSGTIHGDGTGQTIALVDAFNDPDITSDLATFDTTTGTPAPPSFTVVEQDELGQAPANSATSGQEDWSGEESLDVEWAHAMAPGASIVLVEAYSDSGTYLEQADKVAAAITGVSAVSNSYGGGESSSETSLDSDFLTPSGHTGVTFFASTGDTGATVSYPATSPYVVAVGGTQLTVSGTTWSSETAWSDGGGGTSSYEGQPTFQTGTITATKREVPDISIAAGQNSGSSNCYVAICDSWDTSSGNTSVTTNWEGVVGTSWSSPMTAALVAIADQGRSLEGLPALQTSTGVNQTDTRLYQLSKANFHDITTGSNGHSAVVGYDEATGIGTPIANVLVPDLAGAASVTGRVFIDNSGNGVYGGTDTPVAGATVYLDLNNDGSLDNSEPSVTTNSQGIYTFTDVPAGGTIRLTSAAPTGGYSLASGSTAAITYGATDTANFYYQATASKLGFTQQPQNASAGTTLSPIVVNVENSVGATVPTNASTITLTLSSGTFSTGSNTATAVASGGVATFSGLQINSAGNYTLTASAGALTTATSSSFSITVTQTTPTVSWTAPASITYGTALSSTQLDATASVPGTFAYTPPAGTVLGVGAGQTLSVLFTPTDTTDYTTATDTASITVTQATPTVSWTTPAAITYGTALSSTQLDATASVPGTFAYTPSSGTVLNAGTGQSLSVVFTPTDTTDYTKANGSSSITVLQATPTVSWTSPSPITYGTALSSTQLDATASVPGTFAYTPASGTVLNAGTGQTLSVVFTPTDTTDYTKANGSSSITVLQATPTVSWTSPSAITYGTALSSTQLDATASVPGTFAYTPASGTVLNAGTGQMLKVVFTPTDTTDYTKANGSSSITVLQATPTVSWANPSSIVYGTALSSAQLDATASVPGTFAYTPASGTVLNAGTGQMLKVVFTPTDTADYTKANGSSSITVLQATPTVSWTSPSAITYGTALSSTQLDATANVPGTFAYTPSAGTILPVGDDQSLSTTFTPTDTTDYTNATATQTIDVIGTSTGSIVLTGSTFYVELDNSDPQNVEIWTNSTASGTPAVDEPFNQVSSITLSANAAGDSFTADFSNGNVVPSGGLTFTGFGPAAGNTLTVVGTGGSDTVTVPGNGTYNINSQTVDYSTGSIGNVYFSPGSTGDEALTVPSSTVTLAPNPTTGITAYGFASITVGTGAEVVVPTAANHANRLLVQTAGLTLAGSASAWTGTLDLSNNDLDVAGGSLATITSQVAQGYVTGTTGIISSAAQADPTHLTTLGVIQNSVDGTPTGAPLYGLGASLGVFDNANPANTDVLVKYTYYGDANLDGVVNGADYTRIDNGISSSASGWFNGNFNYDTQIDGSDYTLIDNTYNQQGGSTATELAKPAAVVATGQPASTASPGLFSDTTITQETLKRKHSLVVDVGLTAGA